jgi:hypothetical protein
MKTELAGSHAWQVAECGDGETLYVVENPSLEALLFDRNSIGRRFKRLCLDSSELFLSHLADELRAEDDISELVVLSKGLSYQLNEAFANVFGETLPMNLISTRRAKVSTDDVQIEVSYSRIDAPTRSVIIGDTVASGATLIATLESYRSDHALDSVYVLSYAGSLLGAQRISKYCSTNGVSLRMIYGLGALGLAPNGFDLSFLDAETVTDDRYRQKCRELFSGNPVSAVGWDFGSQWMAPEKYRQLCWLEAKKWGMHGHPAFAIEKEPPDLSLLGGEAAAFPEFFASGR